MKITVGVREYAPGAIIAGKYRLLHRLGQGGMGSIWAAHNPTLDISVALKLIRLDAANDDAHARLIQEARATARLADPGIVRIFDVGQTEQGDPFITMELLTGSNLRETLGAGPLDPVRAVRTLLPIARALECAHRAGIVHRDVKPDNIVLAVGARGDLQPKLVDFGVAKILTRPNQLTSVGAAVGSPLYMSPEQARGEPIDARTDLWSICVVLFESIMGTPPFDAVNSNALLHAIATQAAPTLAGRGVCDGALSKIIDRGLSKRREERWRHARDLMLALAEWLRHQGVADDITGLSLRGRGVGRSSSLPKALAAASEVERAAKVNPNAATAVGLLRNGRAGEGEAEAADAAAGDAGGGAFGAMALGTSPERRARTLLWAGLGFIVLALGVLGGVLLRRPPTPRAERAAPVQPASDVASGATSTAASQAPRAPARPATAPLPARDSAVAPTAPAAASPPATAVAKPAVAPEKPAGAAAAPRREPVPTKASPKPAPPKRSRAPGAFKNPFE